MLDEVENHLRILRAQQPARQAENEDLIILHHDNEDPNRNVT